MNKNTISKPLPFSVSRKLLGFTYALSACLLFSIKPIFIKLAYVYGGNAVSIMSLRAFSSLPIYITIGVVLLLRSKANRKALKWHGAGAVAIGVLGYYLSSLLDILSLQHISAQLERLLLFLYPSLVILINWVWTKKKPSQQVCFATLLGYIGVAIIFIHDFQLDGDRVLTGATLVLGAALSFALYVILSKPLIHSLGSLLFTSIGMGSAGIAILIQLSLSNTDMCTWNSHLIILGLMLGVLCTVIPSYLMSAALARLSTEHVSLMNNIGPTFTTVAAVFVLGESFTAYNFIGLVLVMMSIYLLNRSKPSKQ
ncbi:DMT family transporter [Vibrio sp. S4M6]|uniref:DMT family transporter n=1 Tax=Vibrio sinus TaxID=2946865 RepID=UPI002029C761|nr:DMT family transporter [Vibrio sinus]MCL9780074.1 DMT family transporter [Vibrio sinus]